MRFLLLSLALLLAVAAAAQTPYAPPPTASPFDPTFVAQQWRLQEATLKGKALSADRYRDGGATPGMARYDVTWYDLDLTLTPTTLTLSGVVTMRARVVDVMLREVEFHLADRLFIDAIRLGATTIPFTRSNGVVTATLPRDYLAGEEFALTVVYRGNPEGDSFGWYYIGSDVLIWTLSEPYGARAWWPCKDLNADKADGADIRITVPSQLTAVSNGALISRETSGGQTTFHWREGYPICTYLISVTAHPYTVFSDWYVSAGGDSLEVRNYVVPAYEQQARAGYAIVPAMIAAFAEGFGEYPFMGEKYGHAHFPWGGGMEHQTCSSMIYGYYAQTFVGHELSHQWWGDMITCRTFHDIWLNEGFATWAEAYWREQHEGIGAYRQEMAASRYTGAGTVYVEDPDDFGGIFDYGLSYLKGGWVVHMLRGVLGDDDFFAGLALYRQRFAYGTADTDDLQAAMEAVSGRDLGPFMQQWIHGEYYPRYTYAMRVTPLGGESLVQVRIEQVQTDSGVFVMPIELAFQGSAGEARRRVENDRRVQNYSFTLPGTVTGMQFDPDEWILREATQVTPTDAPLPAPLAATLAAAPNPFNPATTLRLDLPHDATVCLAVFDARGRQVRLLVDGDVLAAGAHDLRWDGRDGAGRPLAAGTYLARGTVGSGASAGADPASVLVQKLTLAK